MNDTTLNEAIMLAHFLYLALADEEAEARRLTAELSYPKVVRGRLESLLREVFRAADINRLGADTCNEVERAYRL